MPTERRTPPTAAEAGRGSRGRAGRDPKPPPPEPAVERVQKTLARAGFGSRRAAEDLIRAGRVSIGGREATLGDRVDPRRQTVAVDGVPIAANPDLRYFALNKPAGVTTTMRDPHAERTLATLLPRGPRVFAVGRLDRDTEGLLLLTNDGELSHRLQHPSFSVEKEYLVEVGGSITREAIRGLTQGVALEDGVARALRVGRVQRTGARSSVELVMVEGRKREVRRMLAGVGFPVWRLVRVRVGPVRLGGIRPGQVRPLDPDEVVALYRVTGMRRARPRPR